MLNTNACPDHDGCLGVLPQPIDTPSNPAEKGQTGLNLMKCGQPPVESPSTAMVS